MATLRDVALEAQVSLMTVSRALNEPERVSPATLKRVEAAARTLHYQPNLTAKALVQKRLGVVNVYIPAHIDLSNSFAMHWIAGISEVLSRYRYSFLLIRDRETLHRCDGYIVMGLFQTEWQAMADFVALQNVPAVLFGHAAWEGVATVDVDNALGMRLTTEHLLALGHRRLALLTVDEAKDYAQDRLLGYRQALGQAGVPWEPEAVYQAANEENSGFQRALTILAERRITALACATDVLALGTVRAARELGLRVPEDLSVTGFDGLGVQHYTEPRITTVRQPVYEAGQALAQQLMNRLQAPSLPVTHTRLMPELLLGGSTAAPADAKTDPDI